mgnify:CR=1 FL=1
MGFSQIALANDVDEFIESIYVPTYDCPDDQFVPQIEQYLKESNLSGEQAIKLKVHKAHWLICVGKSEQAQAILDALIIDPNMDKTSQSYASAHYQLGYIFDVQEKPERCGYYHQAESLAKGRFNDVHLSAQLGLITVCNQDNPDIGAKLGRLFSLLQFYADSGDLMSLAHIHNNIGLFYASIGQRALAAEQYQKTYELGLKVYEEKNQLAPLISLITSYTGSGDFENANLMIEELRLQNLKVNTPLSNSWYHFAKSRQSYRTNDYEGLRKSLRSWDVFLKQISRQTMHILYEWYVTALCVHDEDRQCVEAFLQRQHDSNLAMPASLSKHLHYTGFLVEAHLFLGNIQQAQLSFENYQDISLDKVKKQQSSALVLGAANLHNEIFGLESSLEQAQTQRLQLIFMVSITILGILGLLYLTLGRKYLEKLATDPLTGLSNEQSVLSKIKKTKAPYPGKVNALALFDVSNFTAVNDTHGYNVGEITLKQVTKCLQQVTREKDLLGRLGANQFIVCLINIEDNVAEELLSRVQTAIEDLSFKVGSETVDIRANMHIYSSDTGLNDVDDVLSEIRQVLQKNK